MSRQAVYEASLGFFLQPISAFLDDPEDAFKQERLQNYVDRIADSDVVAKIKEWLDK